MGTSVSRRQGGTTRARWLIEDLPRLEGGALRAYKKQQQQLRPTHLVPGVRCNLRGFPSACRPCPTKPSWHLPTRNGRGRPPTVAEGETAARRHLTSRHTLMQMSPLPQPSRRVHTPAAPGTRIGHMGDTFAPTAHCHILAISPPSPHLSPPPVQSAQALPLGRLDALLEPRR